MLFNSIPFLVFFPTVVVAYFLLPSRLRWLWLLAASYFFYAYWEVTYLALIVGSTLVDYWVGLRMEASDSEKSRRRWLYVSLATNLGLLFTFKYFNFFLDSFREMLTRLEIGSDIPHLDVLLPVGISFYTFQTLSYSIDVYRRTRSAERHLGIFALYVAFFPQLVAGPIERSAHLLPQFYKRMTVDYDRIASGLKLMLWGFFKKVVIADRLAEIVNQVYGAPSEYHGLQVAVATYCFAFQIFCDFSGYSDIAIGAARVMGFDLMKNFNRPYFSKSIAEFWRRWHISLSTWFRDYLYYPLGGNRVSRERMCMNLMVVFLVSGLWHGARWTFIIWGAIHGTLLVLSVLTARRRAIIWAALRSRVPMLRRVRRLLAIVWTFHLVLLAWVFFRAKTLSDACELWQNLFVADFASYSLMPAVVSPYDFTIAFGVVAALLLAHWFERKSDQPFILMPRPLWRSWLISYALILAIVVFGRFDHQEFLYFQF